MEKVIFISKYIKEYIKAQTPNKNSVKCFSLNPSAIKRNKGFIGRKLSPYFTPMGDQVILCELCPRECEVGPGERGFCEVRENINEKYYTLVYVNP